MSKFILKSAVLFVVLCLTAVYALDFPYSEWSLANYSGASANFNEGFISVTNGGSDYWHVQLTRNNIELQAGKTYEVKFYLQGVSNRRYVEVRIGRNAFPYDAFAEFGEVVAPVNGRLITKTFTMQSGNVNNARFEFNLGKNSGTVYLSDVSLNCLDCGSNQNVSTNNSSTISTSDWDYIVIADTVDFRDYSMSLGNVFGQYLELGADSKIYGNVDASNYCFLRERANISGNLRYSTPCTEQNNIKAKAKSTKALSKPVVSLPNIVTGISLVSVGLDETITLPPGNYGVFYANARSKVHFTSGSYTFQNIFTEPDVKFVFDLTSSPVSIGVLENVRFGDRNTFAISGGNPSEIQWNIAGEKVDMGTDGLYFGQFTAPSAFVRIPSRSHLVGAVYARKFQIEPQSTISQEPRATEISHSEEHFGPFFMPGIFRYVSQLPLSASSIEMFVYADSSQIKVNKKNSRIVELSSLNQNVEISLTQNKISGFPIEAFKSKYIFNFNKSENYRIYWNPQTQCKEGCDGTTPATAIGDFATVLETAKATGKEINMAGGIWNVTDNFTEGVVPWKVGFELVGYKGDIWDLNSEKDLPLINLGNAAHVEIEGRSPRSIIGLRFENGFNDGNGGAISSNNSSKLKILQAMFQNNISKANGGAISFSGDSLIASQIHIAKNQADGFGGGLFVRGKSSLQNIFFIQNSSKEMGAALYTHGTSSIQNSVLSQNTTNKYSSIAQDSIGNLDIWNATLFKNIGAQNGPEIAGQGNIWNSIIWKNLNGSIQDSVATRISVNYSLSSRFNIGTSNYKTDPIFKNESALEESNYCIGVDAGLAIDVSSPIADKGDKEHSLSTDILGVERGETFPFGAYGIYVTDIPVQYGLWYDDEFHDVGNSRPVFENFPSIAHIEFAGHSAYGRVMKTLVKKHEKTKISKAIVRISLMDSTGNVYPDAKSIDIPFYRSGIENGKYVFMSLIKGSTEDGFDVEKHGHYVLFSRRPEDQGFYDEFVVIYVKKNSDRLKYEVVKW